MRKQHKILSSSRNTSMGSSLKLVLALFLWMLAACRSPLPKEASLDKPIQVKIQAVEIVEYNIPVRAIGSLSPTTKMKLSFKTGGIVRQLNVKEGQSVTKGEVLAVLDLSEITAQANQARIGVEKAERDLRRAGNLYRDSVVTLEQFENVKSANELARAQKQIADFNLEHSKITAPTEGQILKLLVEANEIIAPGYPAILFASRENDWVVKVALTDKDIVKLKLGDTALITMDAFPGSTFKSFVSEMGTLADPLTGTYETELSIIQASPLFRTGFITRADIYPSITNRATVIPIEALLDANDRSGHVFIYLEGTVEKREVITGPILGDRITVPVGLEEGELVITEGAKYLGNDSRVIAVKSSETKLP